MARAPIKFTGTKTVANKKVGDFEHVMDPQRWQDNAPALWTTSRIINDQKPLPADRDVDPEVLDEIKRQIPKGTLFFEVVVIPFLARYRNILKTSLTKRKNKDDELESIEFDYEQFDCLTGEFFGTKSYGSIDADRGRATCEDATKRIGNKRVGPDRVKITISKTVRFTQPKANLEFVDLFSRIAVRAVLELLLFGLDQ